MYTAVSSSKRYEDTLDMDFVPSFTTVRVGYPLSVSLLIAITRSSLLVMKGYCGGSPVTCTS